MKKNIKIVFLYIIFVLSTKIALLSIDSIIFNEADFTKKTYFLSVSIMNILPVIFVKIFNIKKDHILTLLVIDAYLITQSLWVNSNLLWIVTLIYFIINCILLYRLNKKIKIL
ncbi:hypothetical protein HMPREF9630_02120 [Peptoanaerobacter stomatis]|uniref:Uncharacterized protein n=1 Tax=Peptoanaerobacter stomatis TaxID=796937 RepID=U6Q1E8_9FIRM|nr:hypothetical protein [Peptoanaerobacter stomatis]EJZ44321.1 hypothetical protein HMPREF9630_02120 [Peptoanaerobacter stomatis]